MEISCSKSAAFGFFCLSLQLLSVCFPEVRSGRISCGSSRLQQMGLDFPVAVSYCHAKEMLLYQSKFNLHFMQSGDFFVSRSAVIVSFSHLSCIQTVVCWKEYYYF